MDAKRIEEIDELAKKATPGEPDYYRVKRDKLIDLMQRVTANNTHQKVAAEIAKDWYPYIHVQPDGRVEWQYGRSTDPYALRDQALLPRLVEALKYLSNEAGGLLVFDYELRQVISNTNYNCLKLRVDEARAALKAVKG